MARVLYTAIYQNVDTSAKGDTQCEMNDGSPVQHVGLYTRQKKPAKQDLKCLSVTINWVKFSLAIDRIRIPLYFNVVEIFCFSSDSSPGPSG